MLCAVVGGRKGVSRQRGGRSALLRLGVCLACSEHSQRGCATSDQRDWRSPERRRPSQDSGFYQRSDRTCFLLLKDPSGCWVEKLAREGQGQKPPARKRWRGPTGGRGGGGQKWPDPEYTSGESPMGCPDRPDVASEIGVEGGLGR